MPTLLHIDVSPRGDYSASTRLGRNFIDAWLAKNPDGKVVTRDVHTKALPIVDLPWIGAAYSTPDQHTPEQQAAIKISDELVDELLAADEVLIASPFYNFSLPAALKAWIDHIVRFNRTFTAKYEGLAAGRKVYAIVASGGDYSPGAHMAAYDVFTPVLNTTLGFIGMKDIAYHYAVHTNDVSQGKRTMDDYLAEHTPKMLAKFAL